MKVKFRIDSTLESESIQGRLLVRMRQQRPALGRLPLWEPYMVIHKRVGRGVTRKHVWGRSSGCTCAVAVRACSYIACLISVQNLHPGVCFFFHYSEQRVCLRTGKIQIHMLSTGEIPYWRLLCLNEFEVYCVDPKVPRLLYPEDMVASSATYPASPAPGWGWVCQVSSL